VFVALLALVLLAPAALLIATAIRRDSPGPVLYRQERRGRGSRTFTLYKFRTMAVDAEAQLGDVMHLNVHAERGDPRMYKIADDPRVTRAGAILRRHSLDELPQLVNVLRGDMSLVGPRPLTLMEDAHVPTGSVRRSVRPGLTGPWQVSGRNELSFEQMLALDCAYAERHTLLGDLVLLARTLPVLARPQARL
jgi:lipopolysaccharide/colanic/teichoic acid biosynthesis glycosyltransferase